ncbi:MAG: hypothetical protein HOL58_05615 [Francisellaceae bacterium]|nr:hypothetical protein [Francisellaceae bacterium]
MSDDEQCKEFVKSIQENNNIVFTEGLKCLSIFTGYIPKDVAQGIVAAIEYDRGAMLFRILGRAQPPLSCLVFGKSLIQHCIDYYAFACLDLLLNSSFTRLKSAVDYHRKLPARFGDKEIELKQMLDGLRAIERSYNDKQLSIAAAAREKEEQLVMGQNQKGYWDAIEGHNKVNFMAYYAMDGCGVAPSTKGKIFLKTSPLELSLKVLNHDAFHHIMKNLGSQINLLSLKIDGVGVIEFLKKMNENNNYIFNMLLFVLHHEPKFVHDLMFTVDDFIQYGIVRQDLPKVFEEGLPKFLEYANVDGQQNMIGCSVKTHNFSAFIILIANFDIASIKPNGCSLLNHITTSGTVEMLNYLLSVNPGLLLEEFSGGNIISHLQAIVCEPERRDIANKMLKIVEPIYAGLITRNLQSRMALTQNTDCLVMSYASTLASDKGSSSNSYSVMQPVKSSVDRKPKAKKRDKAKVHKSTANNL